VLLPRELVLRDFVVLRDDFAAPVARFAAEPVPADLRVAGDLARVEDDFLAAPLERDVLLAGDFAREVAERVVRAPVRDDFLAPDFAAVEREEELDARPPLAVPPLLLEASIDHLPDMTRCAASATASAMSAPSLVALAATLLAACDAVSAASRPASRIFFRAPGLAAIAAAAAVSPAASISLLIAALASLSTVLLFEPERADDELERDLEVVEREEVLPADFAIFYLPASRKRHFKAVPVP
jgi:hypothetical protein